MGGSAVQIEKPSAGRFTINPQSSSGDPQDPIESEAAQPAHERWIHWIFLGPGGIRSPWRVLVAIALYECFVYVLAVALASSPSGYVWLRALSQRGAVLTPGLLLFGEAIRTAAALFAGLAMAKVEDRTFSDYRVPWNEALGKRFWQGAPLGLAMLALLMWSIRLLGAVSFGRQALDARAVIRSGALYALGYLLVALFEEATFRGYLQATLETDFGFWPTAVVLSIIFGAIHWQNPGESRLGMLMAGCFGLVAAFSVRRTRNVWFAVGLHAAWDWGQSYLFGVSNSGVAALGHLLNPSFHGPSWLTGGLVGPEGSLLVFPVLLLWAVAIHLMFPAERERS